MLLHTPCLYEASANASISLIFVEFTTNSPQILPHGDMFNSCKDFLISPGERRDTMTNGICYGNIKGNSIYNITTVESLLYKDGAIDSCDYVNILQTGLIMMQHDVTSTHIRRNKSSNIFAYS